MVCNNEANQNRRRPTQPSPDGRVLTSLPFRGRFRGDYHKKMNLILRNQAITFQVKYILISFPHN